MIMECVAHAQITCVRELRPMNTGERLFQNACLYQEWTRYRIPWHFRCRRTTFQSRSIPASVSATVDTAEQFHRTPLKGLAFKIITILHTLRINMADKVFQRERIPSINNNFLLNTLMQCDLSTRKRFLAVFIPNQHTSFSGAKKRLQTCAFHSHVHTPKEVLTLDSTHGSPLKLVHISQRQSCLPCTFITTGDTGHMSVSKFILTPTICAISPSIWSSSHSTSQYLI